MGKSAFFSALAGGASLLALTYTLPVSAQSDQPAASSNGGLEEVVVTARRKEEKAQSVPIALTTFSQTTLETQQVRSIADLDKDTPGIAICCNRDSVYNIWIRGIAGAVAYFDEVPLINFNGYSLFFDTGSFQVLKGPQGTLFGQSADGGAILYESKAPVNDFEGSVEGAVGDYNHHEAQFVLNVPVIDDKLLVRIGGVYNHTDGYVKDLTTGVETGSENYWIARGTVTWRPTDDIQNDFLVNVYSSNNTGSGSPLAAGINPAGLFPLVYGPAVINPTSGVVAVQQRLGRYAYIGGEPPGQGGERSSSDSYTLIDTTRWDLNDNLSLKNIIGYQQISPGTQVYAYQFGLPYAQFPLSAGAVTQLNSHPLVPGNTLTLYTEELRVEGKFFDDKLSYTIGTFNDFSGIRQAVAPTYVAQFGGVSGSLSEAQGRTNAVYGQGTYDLSAVVDGLSFTGGYRYTWDKQVLNTQAFDGTGALVSNIGEVGHWHAPSYNLSLDYQMTPSTLLYITDAKGYSKGGFNPGNFAAAAGLETYQPENLNNVEIGIKTDWELFGIKTRTNLAGFYGFYDDVQIQTGTLVNSPVPGQPPSISVLTTNAATAHIEGIEGELTVVPTDSVTIHGAMTYLKFKYDKWTGIDLDTGKFADLSVTNPLYSPKWKWTLDVTYKLPIDESMGDLAFTATASHVAHQVSDLSVLDPVLYDDVPAYDNVDLSLSWHNVMGSNGLDARAYVTNVLENVWADGSCLCYVASSLGMASRSVAVPREWGMSVRYSFGPNNMASHETAAAYTPPPVTAPKMAPAPHSYLVFFDFDKSDLTPQATQIVDQAAQNAGPSHVTRIDVTGHTDTVGSDAYNMRLSKRRAESVAAELEHQGVPSSEISIIAKGKHDLLVPTADGVREPQNRRVEIVYEGGMGAGI